MTNKNTVTVGQDKNLDKKYKLWRIRAFWGTWLAYVGFYICRKTIAVAQPEFMKEFGWTKIDVGIILSGYLCLLHPFIHCFLNSFGNTRF